MDAFDADALIYAATDHPFRRAIRRVLRSGEECVGSVLLIPEVLSKPLRTDAEREVDDLLILLDHLTLLPCDLATARLAASLGASYGLRAADAVTTLTPAPSDRSSVTR